MAMSKGVSISHEEIFEHFIGKETFSLTKHLCSTRNFFVQP